MASRDPYYIWLGISDDDRPLTHYNLLGLERFENDPIAIQTSADYRLANLETIDCKYDKATVRKLIAEIKTARKCLLDENQKRVYDTALELSQKQQALEDALNRLPTVSPHTAPSRESIRGAAIPSSQKSLATVAFTRKRKESSTTGPSALDAPPEPNPANSQWPDSSSELNNRANEFHNELADGPCAEAVNDLVIPEDSGAFADDLPAERSDQQDAVGELSSAPWLNPNNYHGLSEERRLTKALIVAGICAAILMIGIFIHGLTSLPRDGNTSVVAKLSAEEQKPIEQKPIEQKQNELQQNELQQNELQQNEQQQIEQQQIEQQQNERKKNELNSEPLDSDLREPNQGELDNFEIETNHEHKTLVTNKDRNSEQSIPNRIDQKEIIALTESEFPQEDSKTSNDGSIKSPKRDIRGVDDPFHVPPKLVDPFKQPASDRKAGSFFSGERTNPERPGLPSVGSPIENPFGQPKVEARTPASPEDLAATKKSLNRKRGVNIEQPDLKSDEYIAKTELFVKTYGRDLDAATTPIARAQILDEILDAANATKDPIARFVMFHKTVEFAAKFGDPSMAIQAIEALEKEFKDIDYWTLISGSIDSARRLARSDEQINSIEAAATKIMERIDDDQKFDFSERVINLGLWAAQQTGDLNKIRFYEEEEKQVQHWLRVESRYQKAIEKLKQSPNDSTAYVDIGNYHCFVAGNLNEGIKAWLKSDSAVHQDIAQAESAPDDVDDSDLLKTAATWERIAAKYRGFALAEEIAHQRALRWYKQAARNLDGSKRERAKEKIAKLGVLIDPKGESIRKLQELLEPFKNLANQQGVGWFFGSNEFPLTMQDVPDLSFETDGGRIKIKKQAGLGQYQIVPNLIIRANCRMRIAFEFANSNDDNSCIPMFGLRDRDGRQTQLIRFERRPDPGEHQILLSSELGTLNVIYIAPNNEIESVAVVTADQILKDGLTPPIYVFFHLTGAAGLEINEIGFQISNVVQPVNR